jgi:2,4-dienoyl-CoA reductase (NADPH2)
MARLEDPVTVGTRSAPSRVVFGAHETNLGRDRAISERHVAYYEERASGGAGIVVVETASVDPSDWPYERAPLAEVCGLGWSSVAEACDPHGTLVLAGLGHSGAQGSSAYSQSVMWAPSRVADVATRELPMEMEQSDIDQLVRSFGAGARHAVASGLDGVEIDAGAYSLLRQFHSGLTNQRSDQYGSDRLRLTCDVLRAARAAVGPDRVLSLRLCCDELAPWAGVTPEHASEQVAVFAELVDLLVVVRGGPYSTAAYRPDGHTPAGFNLGLCRQMRDAVAGKALVVLQGSVVDPSMAQAALDDGTADLVEMTRAQIADPRLVGLVRRGDTSRVRPCVLCNQACHVRDNRNPIVSCIGEPRSGHESVDPRVECELSEGTVEPADPPSAQVLVVGGGVAGLECARVLALRGHRTRVVERSERAGGALRGCAVGKGREQLAGLAEWLIAECAAQGVVIETGVEVSATDLDDARAAGNHVVLATGSRQGPVTLPAGGCPVIDPLELLEGGLELLPDGPVVVHDPVGGPVGVGVAEWLAAFGRDVALVTQDQVAGNLLSLTGDLADANTRLQRAGVRRELRSLLRSAAHGEAHLHDVWTGDTRVIDCAVIVDCGHRLAEDALYRSRPDTLRAGDCVAPRTVLEAVLEGRRIAMTIAGGPSAERIPAGAGVGS